MPKACPRLSSAPRIALFSGNYNYLRDGCNQALNRLVRHAQDRTGATVRVYSPVGREPAFPPEGELVPVPSLPIPFRSEYRLALGLPYAIREDFFLFSPDLVHLSAPDLLGTRALAFARRLGIPVVTSLHTRFETYFGYYGLGGLRRLAESHLRRFYGRSDFILAPTSALVRELAEVHGRGRVRLWGRGVDAKLFDPAKRSRAWRASRGIGRDTVAVAFFGRLVREKCTGLFAETIAVLRAAGRAVAPVVIGEGPERGKIERELGNAAFTGHLEGTALATALASCDIIVNPSLTEAFGNVVLESFAAGVPIVAADTASMRNLIEDGRNGLLCALQQPQAYAAATARLIEDKALRARIGAAARRSAMAYSWEATLDPVLNVYAEALAAVRPTARESLLGGEPAWTNGAFQARH